MFLISHHNSGKKFWKGKYENSELKDSFAIFKEDIEIKLGRYFLMIE